MVFSILSYVILYVLSKLRSSNTKSSSLVVLRFRQDNSVFRSFCTHGLLGADKRCFFSISLSSNRNLTVQLEPQELILCIILQLLQLPILDPAFGVTVLWQDTHIKLLVTLVTPIILALIVDVVICSISSMSTNGSVNSVVSSNLNSSDFAVLT